MKVNRSSRSNLGFLYGSVFFFAVLILTMVLFTYYAIDEASRKNQSGIFAYSISLAGNNGDKGCDILFDDSLLFSSCSIMYDTTVVVNRRFISDTIFKDGKMSVRERLLFSQESLLHVIEHGTGDTLTVNVGNNSKVRISFPDGKLNVGLYK